MKETRLIIIGASFAFEVIDLVNEINKKKIQNIKIVGILDDNKSYRKKKIRNVPVIGEIKDIKKFKTESINISINNFRNRFVQKKIIKKYSLKPSRFLTLIHPKSHIGSNTKIGNGSVIFQFVNIVANVVIKDNTRVNPFTSITPGCVIGSNCTISHGVKIGVNSIIKDECFIGTGSIISENIKLSSGIMLCENSYANKSININRAVLIGNPARVIAKS